MSEVLECYGNYEGILVCTHSSTGTWDFSVCLAAGWIIRTALASSDIEGGDFGEVLLCSPSDLSSDSTSRGEAASGICCANTRSV